MKNQKCIGRILVLALTLFGVRQGFAFTSLQKATISASVTVSGTGSNFSIQASTLPSTAFFGKNAVMPVTLTSHSGPVDPKSLNAVVVFQLLDAHGALLGPSNAVPITFTQDLNNPNALIGHVVVPAIDLKSIENGGQLTYLFEVRQGGSGTMHNNNGNAPAPPATIAGAPDLGVYAPFKTQIIDHVCGAVGPSGGRVGAPDLSFDDGQTAVSFAPGVVQTPGTACIRTEDAARFPTGPGGSKAAAIYSIELQDTSLSGPADIVLTYPSDPKGKVLDLGADPRSLGIYYLDLSNGAIASGAWRPLSRASLDTTLHTLSGKTSHFSAFGLFAAGAIGSAGLRPSERIITPNGDAVNDTVTFSGLSGQEEVHLFNVRGRRVRTIAGPSPVWDGTDDSGQIVESGVYLYQYSSQGERVSGVIGVAK